MACADVQTIQAGDGSKSQFSFDFPYVFKSEIHVYLWDDTTKDWEEKIKTDPTYPWQITDANPTIVEFTGTVPPTPVDPTQDNVKIRRITDTADVRAIFNPGSAIRSNDLNINFEQLRYAIQEANCAISGVDLDYLREYYWDTYSNTVYSYDTWVSDDVHLATTAAIENRIGNKIAAELANTSGQIYTSVNQLVSDSIDTALTNDIGVAPGSGLSVTDDGDGTITLDFDQTVTLNAVAGSGINAVDNGDGTITLDLDIASSQDAITSTTPTEGQVPVWNNTTQQWEPVTVANYDSGSSTWTGNLDGVVKSDIVQGGPGSVQITNMVKISQANYDALTTPDTNTLYVIC
jgi:hypothetical protein